MTDRILVIKGRVDHKQEGETKLLAQELTPFEPVPERREVRLRLDAQQGAGGDRPRAHGAGAGLPGRRAGVRRHGDADGEEDASSSGPSYRVAPSSDFLAEVKHLLGEAAVLQ